MLVSSLATLALVHALGAQSPTIALWRDAESGVDIRMTREPSGRLTGRIAAIRDSVDEKGRPAQDAKNPEASLRARPILGLPMLSGMRAREANTWDDGSIYDARSGKTYKASMRLTHRDTLKVKGFVQLGFVTLGRTAVWGRLADKASAP
jgi:uncharacterized protein (DUF2147 family)